LSSSVGVNEDVKEIPFNFPDQYQCCLFSSIKIIGIVLSLWVRLFWSPGKLVLIDIGFSSHMFCKLTKDSLLLDLSCHVL